jgi:gliding motility-associated-like protein
VLTISQPPLLTVTTSKTNATCFGGINGTAQASAAGGTAPYTYAWTGVPFTTPALTGLSAGQYTVTVTDNYGCTASSLVSITQPAQIVVNTSAVGPVCSNGVNGSATAAPAGGTAPYTYSWNTSPVQSVPTATSLTSGVYTVSVTDAAGCTGQSDATVPVTPPVIVTAVTAPVSCFSGNDGRAIATAVNGNAPYTFVWNTSPSQVNDTAFSLPAGTYTVTVTSAGGCTDTTSVTVLQPQKLNASVVSQPSCAGFSFGSATGSATGGTTPYGYSWNTSPAQTSSSLAGLSAGTYVLTVTDSKGCLDTSIAHVGMFPQPQINAGPDDTICAGVGKMLSVSGALTYSWSPASTLSCANCANPFAVPGANTSYTVTGTDANGCIDTDFVNLVVIPRVPVNVDPPKLICPGDSVRLGAGGGISVEWISPELAGQRFNPTPLVRPLVSTTYQVVITENKCFRDTLSQDVDIVPLPTVDLGPDRKGVDGEDIQLHAATTNTVSIAWIPAEGLSCPDCYDPRFTLKGKTTYVARVVNEIGCPATDTINILSICDDSYFYFANTFTPNGDGSNDRFYPQGASGAMVQRFMIYDRWGEIVFSANSVPVNTPEAGWDGTFKNQQLKPDVYVYVIDGLCENGSKMMIRGDITLIR